MSRLRPKYQVFISSTFSDLHAERQAVTLEVLAARHIPSGMESFPATDDRGWQTIQRTIDMADYYVLLLAGRYGTLDPSTDLSWTEREYEYAKTKGVPVLAFLRDKGSITANKMEEGPEMQARIASLVKKVRVAHMYKEWREVDDLKGLVVQALTQHIADDEDGGSPRPGWYRGTDMPSVQVADELARLSSENADLRQRLAAVTSEPVVSVDLGDPDDRNVMGRTVVLTSTQLRLRPKNPPPAGVRILTGDADPSAVVSTHVRHQQELGLLVRIGFRVQNVSGVLVEDARIVMDIEKVPNLRVLDEPPVEPYLRSIVFPMPGMRATPVDRPSRYTQVGSVGDAWEVTAVVGKVQPRSAAWSIPFWIGSSDACELRVVARLYADNIGKTIETPMSIKIDIAEGVLEDPEDSTSDAGPDELGTIGAAPFTTASEPSLELELADPTERRRLGTSASITSQVLRESLSSRSEPYGTPNGKPRTPAGLSDSNAMRAIQEAMDQAAVQRSRRAPLLDPDGTALYRKAIGLLRPLGFWLRNTGKVLVEDVRIVVTIAKTPGLRVVDELPVEPPRSIMDRYRPPLGGGATTTRVADRGGTWEVTARLHKIQPNAAAWSEPFWIGSADVDEVCLAAQIFGDNIAEVVEVPLRVRIETTESYFEVGDDAEPQDAPS